MANYAHNPLIETTKPTSLNYGAEIAFCPVCADDIGRTMQDNPMTGKINMVGRATSEHSDVGAAGDTQDGDSANRRVCTRRIFLCNCVLAGVLGAVVVALAIVGMTTEAAFVRMLRDTPNQIGLYLLLAVGVVMVLMSALGACGGRSAARGGGGGCGLGCYLGRWVRAAATTMVACSVCNAPHMPSCLGPAT